MEKSTYSSAQRAKLRAMANLHHIGRKKYADENSPPRHAELLRKRQHAVKDLAVLL